MSPYSPTRAIFALALSGVLALSTGCEALAKKERLRPDETTRTGSASKAGPSLLDAAAVNAAKLAIDDSLGPSVKALELRAYPDHWVLQAQDPERSGRLFQLEYRDGRLGTPLEMTLRGSGDLEENLFLLGKVAFDKLPELAEKARQEVDPEDGVVDYVLIRRALPFERDVRLRVFVKSPRRDGYLDADQRGRPIEK